MTEDLRAGHRFNAACAAILAGGGDGDDAAGLGEPERGALRKQARDWLRLELAAWANRVDTGTAADRIQAQKTLAPWRDDPDLTGLRDPAAVDRLPRSERQECRDLWRDFDTLLKARPEPGVVSEDRLRGPCRPSVTGSRRDSPDREKFQGVCELSRK